VHETRWGTRLRAAALSADAAPATDVLDVVTDQTPDQTPGQTSGQTSGQIPGEAVIQSTVAQAAGTDATPPSSEAPAAKPLARGKRGVLTAKTRTQGARKPPAKSPA
jgi:hypothetical protein